jgi:CheY-like chemotaxis protein
MPHEIVYAFIRSASNVRFWTMAWEQRTIAHVAHRGATVQLKGSTVCAAGTLVVLVVEDDALLLYSIAHALRSDGWLVLEARTGEEAIAHLDAAKRVDVVFTDIQLSGPLSGWDVAETCRSARYDMPVIYTSGNAADRRRAVSGSRFFEKPYDAALVVKTCEQLV